MSVSPSELYKNESIDLRACPAEWFELFKNALNPKSKTLEEALASGSDTFLGLKFR